MGDGSSTFLYAYEGRNSPPDPRTLLGERRLNSPSVCLRHDFNK
jgi:hypothetical protein